MRTRLVLASLVAAALLAVAAPASARTDTFGSCRVNDEIVFVDGDGYVHVEPGSGRVIECYY